MEALLQELRDYGLKNLSFIIVNSKEPLSVMLNNELQSRVSFPVFQETEEENVWSILKGGKDDMFVYDRCSRLTYYIPFPMSIIHEKQPIVKAAIFSTYFQSPCGQTCSLNTTFQVDLVEEKTDLQSNEIIPDTKVEGEEFNQINKTEHETNVTSIEPDYYETYGNFSWDDTEPSLMNETEYSSNGWNNTNKQNATQQKTGKSSEGNIIDSLMKLFGLKKKSQNEYIKKTIANGSLETFSGENYGNGNQRTTTETPEVIHSHHHNSMNEAESANGKQKNDRCQGAEENVCESWSKQRLIQAQKCCEINMNFDNDIEKKKDPFCQNYGKRRCKKVKIVLKCCLKTEMSTNSTSEVETNTENGETM